MADAKDQAGKSYAPATDLVHLGREPAACHGFVNPPLYRGSTVLFPSFEALEAHDLPYTYGRNGSPTFAALETALCALEGGDACVLAPSGLAAVTTALLAFVRAGDEVLITDSVYRPTRRFCDKMLAPLGVTTRYFDPHVGAGIKDLIAPNTRVVYLETPGSQTFEMQDIPAIVAALAGRDIITMLDNTWATPLYYQPIKNGIDVSIQAATKYLGGHADSLLGTITANARAADRLKAGHLHLGVCAGAADTDLCLRGLRTLDVRLSRHHQSALAVADWLKARAEVAEVLYPALPGAPGHAIWKRDFSGATGLFSVLLNPIDKAQLARFCNRLQLFGMGWSWGGYESLVVPFDPRSYRSATAWQHPGPALRFHIGLEAPADLIADLENGFAATAGS